MSNTKTQTQHDNYVNGVIAYCTMASDSHASQTQRARNTAYAHDNYCGYLVKQIADLQAEIESLDAESSKVTESINKMKKEQYLQDKLADYQVNFAIMQAAIEVHEAFKNHYQQSYQIQHKPFEG